MIVALAALGLAAPLPAQTGALANRVKLSVRETGVYRVTGADLSAAGVKLDEVAPDKIALSCQGQPVACRLTGVEDGRFSEKSAVIFYGEALDTRYTDTNVYWVAWDGEGGLRVDPLALPAAADGELASFQSTVHIEQNNRSAHFLVARDLSTMDPWFWQRLSPQEPANVNFDLPCLVAGAEDAELRVMLRGLTFKMDIVPDHRVVVTLNGSRFPDIWLDDQDRCEAAHQVPTELLKEQGNTLEITVPGDTKAGKLDRVLLNWIEVTYPRSFEMTETGLLIDLPEGPAGTISFTNVPGAGVDLWDITDPTRPTVAPALKAQEGAVRAPMAPGPARTLLAVPAGRHLQPNSIEVSKGPDLRSKGNAADYIIIAHDDLVEPIRPLAQYRAKQGMRVATVPVSSVYDQFSDGIFTPDALRDFLRYAYQEWQRPALRFVLVVGDANCDYRDYTKTGVRNYVPSRMLMVRASVEMASDVFFVDFCSEEQPVFIGRIPAATNQQIAAVTDKIINYESAEPRAASNRVFLLGELEKQEDGTLAGDAAEGLRRAGPALRECGFEVSECVVEIDLTEPRKDQVEAIRREHTDALVSAFGGSFGFVDFHGHGDRLRWAKGEVLREEDIQSLPENAAPPIVLNMSCFTGEFDSPEGPCSGEALLFATRKGTIGFIGPSRLGGYPVDIESFRRLAQSDSLTLGEFAYCSLWRRRVGQYRHAAVGYVTLGDPALRLK